MAAASQMSHVNQRMNGSDPPKMQYKRLNAKAQGCKDAKENKEKIFNTKAYDTEGLGTVRDLR